MTGRILSFRIMPLRTCARPDFFFVQILVCPPAGTPRGMSYDGAARLLLLMDACQIAGIRRRRRGLYTVYHADASPPPPEPTQSWFESWFGSGVQRGGIKAGRALGLAERARSSYDSSKERDWCGLVLQKVRIVPEAVCVPRLLAARFVAHVPQVQPSCSRSSTCSFPSLHRDAEERKV